MLLMAGAAKSELTAHSWQGWHHEQCRQCRPSASPELAELPPWFFGVCGLVPLMLLIVSSAPVP